MKEYNYIFASIFILLGIFFTFCGKKFETPTLMLVLGVLLCYIATIIILNFIPSLIKTEKHLMILLAVGFIIGAIIGIALKGQVRVLAIIMLPFQDIQLLNLFIKLSQDLLKLIR